MPADIAAVRSSSRFALRGPYVIGFVNLFARRQARFWFFLWLTLSFAFGEDELPFGANLRSCRAGTYFRFATKVSKGAPKREGTPFQAVSPLSLETLTSSAERGTPPGFARWLMLSGALTGSRGER